MPQRHPNRKEQILQALAAMLETNAGDKILTQTCGTTMCPKQRSPALSIKGANVWEADFVEETIFSRVTSILSEQHDPWNVVIRFCC